MSKLKEIFGGQSMRVEYLRGRFSRRVITPTEAQELINIYSRYGERLPANTQLLLEKIAISDDKQGARVVRGARGFGGFAAFVESENERFEVLRAELEENKQAIADSRELILASISNLRLSMFGKGGSSGSVGG